MVISAMKLRCLLLGRIAMTNLDSILKSREITLWTKVLIVKDMVFPVVMYGCESWTIKLSTEELMLLSCGVFDLVFLHTIIESHSLSVFRVSVLLCCLQHYFRDLPLEKIQTNSSYCTMSIKATIKISSK